MKGRANVNVVNEYGVWSCSECGATSEHTLTRGRAKSEGRKHAVERSHVVIVTIQTFTKYVPTVKTNGGKVG